jgi:subtilisin family serine protease
MTGRELARQALKPAALSAERERVVPRFSAAGAAAVTFLLTLFAAPALAAPGTRDGAPDRLVVAFDHSADSSDRSAALQDVHATATQTVPALGHADAVTVADGTAASAIAKLEDADGVAWAEVDRPVRATLSLPATGPSRSVWQWGLSNFGQWQSLLYTGQPGVDGDFTSAWDLSTGSTQAPIAVVDTGVDFSNADLAANRVAGGYDYVSNDSDPSPVASSNEATSHGTHVAGIAAASMGINQGSGDITGGAPSAGILAVRALDANGSGYMSTIANAFGWAADHGARVVNASLSGTGPSQTMYSVIAAHPNTLFVVAAGNAGIDEDARSASQRDYPCAYDLANVVCVAAVDSRGNLASFSNYGATSVDVAAPGVDIYSYVLGGHLESWDGTSMATPFVAAAAELAIARTPSVTAPQLRDAILSTARPLSTLSGRTVSGGMIDADALVARVAGLPVQAAPVATAAQTAPATPTAPEQPVSTPADPVDTTPGQQAPSKQPALRSPQLKLAKVTRSGSRLRVSGTLARAWKGTVTVTVCAGRHCSRAHARVTNGRFDAKLAVARGKRVNVTVAAPAARGYRAIRMTRSARS